MPLKKLVDKFYVLVLIEQNWFYKYLILFKWVLAYSIGMRVACLLLMEQVAFEMHLHRLAKFIQGFKMKMKHLAALAVAATALFSASAHAGYVLLDDFSEGNQRVAVDYNNRNDSNTNAYRSLSIAYAPPPPSDPFEEPSSARVSGGVVDGALNIQNPGTVSSIVTVGWNIGGGILPVELSNLQFLFSVIQSDGNPTAAKVYLDGALVSEDSIPSNIKPAMPMNYGIDIDPSLFSGADVHKLEIVLSGDLGWDLRLDALGFTFEEPDPNKVPEPGSLALLSLGLLGVGAARRRSIRANN